MLACLDWLAFGGTMSEEGEQQYAKSVFVVQQMVDELSACVPFHLDYELQPLAKETGQEQYGESPPHLEPLTWSRAY
jgi:hypothetical protein